MLDQDEVRARLIKYQQKYDCKWKYIAKQINVLSSILSGFKNRKIYLWESSITALDNFLKSNGF